MKNVGVRAKEGEFKDDVNLKVQMWNGCKYNGFTVRQVMGSSYHGYLPRFYISFYITRLDVLFV